VAKNFIQYKNPLKNERAFACKGIYPVHSIVTYITGNCPCKLALLRLTIQGYYDVVP